MTVGARIGPKNQTQIEILELYHPSVGNKDLMHDGSIALGMLLLCSY